MADPNELCNTPIEVKIGSLTLKLRRFTLEDLFSTLESNIISERLKVIHRVGDTLEGSDRVEYLRGATKDLPTGEELQDETTNRMGTVIGIREMLLMAATKDQPDLTIGELRGVVTVKEVPKVAALVEWLCGIRESPEPDQEEKDGADESGAEKNESAPTD